MELPVPSIDELRIMSPAEVEATLRGLDEVRRAAEAAVAQFMGRAEQAGLHKVDGHRTPRAFGMAACNWSWADSGRVVQVAHMLAVWPSAHGVGVAQLHALAGVTANPRVRPFLADAEALVVGWARTLDFDDFLTALMHWVATVDPDGSADAFERAHRNRDARIATVGEQTYIDGHCGNAQGAEMTEVFEAYCQAEFLADWEAGAMEHGENMDASKLARTAHQRRADALHAVFLAAAAARASSAGVTGAPAATGPLVNIVMDGETFEHHLVAAAGGVPAPLTPDRQHFCRTAVGADIDPRDAIVAALMGHVRRVVVDSAGVLVNLGRRQRLFTGPVRDAILALQPHCMWHGGRCRSTQVDHLRSWSHGGLTNPRNGGGACDHHNRWRTRGYRTCRGPDGEWHHYRPDGTEVGWRNGWVVRIAVPVPPRGPMPLACPPSLVCSA